MGGTNYSHDDYVTRSSVRAAKGIPTFAHNDNVRTGKAHGVHPSLDPRGVAMRECRDSEAHPVSIPIALLNDLTGSMLSVPITLQAKEPELMGLFLKDRAAGEKYLGDGYPAIMIAGCDDYLAMTAGGNSSDGTLQVGQFESGLEIDDNLTNLWLTGNGGGNWGESYDLFLYFLARHTVHDHWEKRHKKGHVFIIADEPLFDAVSKKAVEAVIGDKIQDDIPVKQIIKEVQKRYWLSLIIPNQTSHYHDKHLRARWKKAIGEQNVLLLEDPTKINELIVSTVAMCEGTATLEDLAADNVATGAVGKAWVNLSDSLGKSVSVGSAAGLPTVKGSAKGVNRL